MRRTTERQERVDGGTAKLVGTAVADFVREASRQIDDVAACRAMANRVNPYGDGSANTRTVRRIFIPQLAAA